MTQYIPYKNAFEKAKKLKRCANIILWISTSLIVLAFSIKNINNNFLLISNYITCINSFLIISYAVLSFISSIYNFKAGIRRREDFIDNSFNTKIAEERSIGYYTNDNLDNGIYKMAVNGFENSLFTYRISKQMTFKIWIKNLIFAFLILFFAIFGFNNAFILFIQLTLPVLILHDAIKHTIFVERISQVFENYRRLFNDLKNQHNIDLKNPEIILNILEYESTLTNGDILLNSKTYKKLNPELSKKWIELKKKYNII